MRSRPLLFSQHTNKTFISRQKMDQSQEAFENLNAKYSAQLATIEDGLNTTSETEKCEQKNNILVKWKDSLIKYNKNCIETIVNSTQILESASDCSYEGLATVRMSMLDSDRVNEQITSVKEVVKQMGMRSKQALNEMRNFVVTFEHQYQANKTLSDENKKLKSQLESVNSQMSKYEDWSSKIEEENMELKCIIATHISIDRTPEMDSFRVALNAKNQEIDGLSKNLSDVKKALDSSISLRLSTSNRTPSRCMTQNSCRIDSPLAMSTPHGSNAMSRTQSKNDSIDVESKLMQENVELKQKFDEITKDFSRKLESCKAELEAKQHQIRELMSTTLQRDNVSSSLSKNHSHELDLNLKEENNDLKRQLAEMSTNFTRQMTLRDQQIDELKHSLLQKTQKLDSATFVIERNVMSRSLSKDVADGISPSQNVPKTSSNRLLLGEEKGLTKYQIKQCESDESNITDAEILDAAKIRLLQKGARTMATLYKEKYDQLRNQRDEIESLRLQLDQCLKNRGSNVNRMLRAENTRCNNCDQLKERLLTITKENKLQIEIYSQKLYLQEGQITTLMAESQQMILKHANLMKCITLCHQELSRYISAN